MPIAAANLPPAQLLAQAAYAGGLGQYSQAYNQFLQPERMQLNQIGSREFQQGRALFQDQLQNLQRLAASQQRQQSAQAFDAAQSAQQRAFAGRQAGFNRLADIMARQQQQRFQIGRDAFRSQLDQEATRNRYAALSEYQGGLQDAQFRAAEIRDFGDQARKAYLGNMQQFDPQTRRQLSGLLRRRQQTLSDDSLRPHQRLNELAQWNQDWEAAWQSSVKQPTIADQMQPLLEAEASLAGMDRDSYIADRLARGERPNLQYRNGQYAIQWDQPPKQEATGVSQHEIEHQNREYQLKQQTAMYNAHSKLMAQTRERVAKQGDSVVTYKEPLYSPQEAWEKVRQDFGSDGYSRQASMNLFGSEIPLPQREPEVAPPPVVAGPTPDPMFAGQQQAAQTPPQPQPAQQQPLPPPVEPKKAAGSYSPVVARDISRVHSIEKEALKRRAEAIYQAQNVEVMKDERNYGATLDQHISAGFKVPSELVVDKEATAREEKRLLAEFDELNQVADKARTIRSLMEQHGDLPRDKWPKRDLKKLQDAWLILKGKGLL